MRTEKLTSKFQMALADAQSLAVGRDHQYIEPAHLLLALLNQDGGTVRPLLAQAGVNANQLRSSLGRALDQLPRIEGAAGEVHVSNELGRLLNVTDKLAQQRSDQYISSELFVLAAVEDKGQAGELLRQAGATKEALAKAIDNVRGGQNVDDPNAEEQRQALEKYTIDLTEKAEQGKLDPVIGRDDEIRRVVQVLQRRTKNNPVLIDEPSVEDTIAILRGLKEKYELHHGVEITDPAIVAAATLSHRYITDRQLPDKAIDLIDEAASRLRMEIDSMPEKMDRLDRRLIQLKIEREALKKESDDASKKRLDNLQEQIAQLEREFSDLDEVWKAEKAALQGTTHVKEELDRARLDLEAARRAGDLARMSELTYGCRFR